MKNSVSAFLQPRSFQPFHSGTLFKKPKEKVNVTFVSSYSKDKSKVNKKEDNGGRDDKNEKKAQKKRKNMTCINLGVDDEEADRLQQRDSHNQKSKKAEPKMQSDRKIGIKRHIARQSPRGSYKLLHGKLPSDYNHGFSFLELDRQKQNLVKFEKRMKTTLKKKKEPRNMNRGENLNQTVKIFEEEGVGKQGGVGLAGKEGKFQMACGEGMQKKEQRANRNHVENINLQLNKSEFNKGHCFNSMKKSLRKDHSLIHKTLSHSRLKSSVIDMLEAESRMQSTMVNLQVGDEVQSKEAEVEKTPGGLDEKKIKVVKESLKLKRFDLKKLGNAIHRSESTSIHRKYVPYDKRKNNKAIKSPKGDSTTKCRVTCPIMQRQSVFTPWDYLPSQRYFLQID